MHFTSWNVNDATLSNWKETKLDCQIDDVMEVIVTRENQTGNCSEKVYIIKVSVSLN